MMKLITFESVESESSYYSEKSMGKMKAISPRLNGRLIVQEQVEESKNEIDVASKGVGKKRRSASC